MRGDQPSTRKIFKIKVLETGQTHLGRVPFKKCHKKWKNSKRGEGSLPKINKSKIQNLDFLIRGGKVRIFRFLPNVDFKCFDLNKKKKIILKKKKFKGRLKEV